MSDGGQLARARWEHERASAVARGLLTTAQAADRMKVPPHIIKTWGRLGLIHNLGAGGKGSVALYDPAELDTAASRRVNLRARGTCSVDGCDAQHQANGLCQNHYRAGLRSQGRITPTPGTPETNAEQTLRHGGHLAPPKSLPYRVLARSCPECGDLLTTPDDLLLKTGGELPACPRCRVMRAVRYAKGRAQVDEAFRRKQLERTERQRRRAQATTVDSATRRYVEWTGPELEIASRADLTARQVAAILGRTLYAVKNMRRKLASDQPREAWLAGERAELHG